MKSPLRLGILGSGRGSNFRAIISQIIDGRVDADVRLVISDVQNAGILSYAGDFNIPSLYVQPGRFKTKLEPEIENDIVRLLQEADVELVVLAGFMRIVKEPLLKAFGGRIINVHPSMLPKYPGLESWKQALEAGEKSTGCTVHLVESGIDSGAILEQRSVPIWPGDTPERLHERIQEAEYAILPLVIQRLALARIDHKS
jgi:phosphoribosylglycinamide formyltransferase 1